MATPPLEIALNSWEEITNFFSHGIETMTLFVPMSHPPDVGGLLLVQLKGPAGTGLPMRVRVREQVFGERLGARVGFDALTPQDKQRLADWLVESSEASRAAAEAAAAAAAQAAAAQAAEQAAAAAAIAAEEAKRPPPPKSALSAPQEQIDQMEAALSQQLERFARLDGYTILGLDSSAGGAQVKEAYARLVKGYHPHHFARHGPKVRKLATKLFVHVQRAHKEAIEIVKTRAYDTDAGERKAGTGPRAGRTLESNAVSQALQLMGLSQFDSARQVLDEALARDPGNPNLTLHRHLVDARSERARGNTPGAVQAYRAVQAINPNHEEARLELEKASMDAPEQSGGLFKRFKGA